MTDNSNDSNPLGAGQAPSEVHGNAASQSPHRRPRVRKRDPAPRVPLVALKLTTATEGPKKGQLIEHQGKHYVALSDEPGTRYAMCEDASTARAVRTLVFVGDLTANGKREHHVGGHLLRFELE